MIFKNKNILFISVKTFDYEKFIVNKLIELGSNVTYFDERPSNSILIKGLIRINKNLIYSKITSYYNKILRNIENKKFDFLFVIKGESTPQFFLAEFKRLNPSCVMIYYTWDSFINNPNALKNLDFFDRKITFDYSDSLKYNIKFRPLFFLDEYSKLRKSIPKNQKLLFIGTAHSDRYIISQNISKWCNSKEIAVTNFYFIPSIFVFLFKYLFDKTFSNFNVKSLSFKPLNLEQVLNKYIESTIILDINHPNQTGLTMRTFEALGSGRKLITTNKNIKNYPFYNSNNILLIDRDQFNFTEEFFELNYLNYDEKFYDEMSIKGWLEFIFNNN
jgi:hypothetical protein